MGRIADPAEALPEGRHPAHVPYGDAREVLIHAHPSLRGRKLDARPDRVDLRDRPYLPRLASLPDRYPDSRFIARKLPGYTQAGLILDQRQEGACTGFGLAAVVNYLFWKNAPSGRRTVTRVSPRMLYHLARFYDEWPGEDYEGSSCRGR